jgi:hypothetical protein
MKGDHTSCLTHPKTGKVNCRQPEILIDGGHAGNELLRISLLFCKQ